ncbi:hypothetical protein RKD54_002809 [Pseudarthrobacter sp. SLBN-100]
MNRPTQTTRTAMYIRYPTKDWRNRMGPMTGMLDRTGISMMSSPGGELNWALLACITVLKRKPVTPETRTFSTTPTMIWLTRYLMLNSASTMDTTAPATAAAASPMKGFCVMLATMAAVKAPPRSWPSMAMFTTPTRSHRTPDKEPKTSGTARVTDPATRPAREMFGVRAPPTTQMRNAVTNRTMKATVSQPGAGLPLVLRYTA